MQQHPSRCATSQGMAYPASFEAYCRFSVEMAENSTIPRYLAVVSWPRFHARWRIPTLTLQAA